MVAAVYTGATSAGGDDPVLQWTGGRSGGTGVHGFGEQVDDFNLDGRLIPVVTREQGVGRSEQPLTLLATSLTAGLSPIRRQGRSRCPLCEARSPSGRRSLSSERRTWENVRRCDHAMSEVRRGCTVATGTRSGAAEGSR